MQGHLGAKANFCSSLWPWPPRSWPSCLRGLSLSTQGGQKRGHSAEVQGQSPKRLKGRSSCTCFVSQPRQGLGLQRCRSLIKGTTGGFPGGPVAKTPHSQCRWPGVNPWSGNYIPHAATKILYSQKKKKKRNAQKCKSHCSHNSLSLWASDVTSRGVHSLVWKR